MLSARLFFHVLICFLPLGGQAGVPAQELILKVPVLSEQSVNTIRKQLLCLEGVHFCGYHVESSCLLLRFLPARIGDPDIIATTICALNRQLEVLPVDGYTIYDVIDGKYPALK
ncbi:MAG: hypothetical protein JNL88_13320 [Bacteroidia bacterium]|nr:hypothetical protein [Bacteroidia bacterium]